MSILFLAILADRLPAGVATLPFPFAAFFVAFFVEDGDNHDLAGAFFFGVDFAFFPPLGFISVKPTISTSRHTIAPI